MEDTLTIEERIRECKKVIGLKNPVRGFLYFLNTYTYIENKETKSAIKLKLWPEQEKIVPNFVESQLLIVLKARQLGLTWITAAFVLWQCIRNPLFLTVVISVTEDLAIEFLERVYFIADRLPIWLGVAGMYKTRTKQTLELKHGEGLVSTIKSLPTIESGAQSKTPNLLIMDEACLSRFAKSIFNSSYPGIEAAKGSVIVISNSIKQGDGWLWVRDTYVASMRGLNKFKRIFLPWDAHPGRPETFKQDMISAGMTERDVNENYPDTEEQAIEDRNIRGVYYAKQMADARKEKRICAVPWSPGYEVYTFWDLGVSDATVIWFMQQIGLQFRFIDYYENVGMGMTHYAKILKEKPYVYGDHYMPHDVEKRAPHGDTDVALSLKEVSENLGIEPILTVAKAKDTQAIINAIEAGRNILPQCIFDEIKCAKGITCLESYRSEWDEENQVLSKKPLENFAIHGADGFRTFAQGYQLKVQTMPHEKLSKSYLDNAGTSWMGG